MIEETFIEGVFPQYAFNIVSTIVLLIIWRLNFKRYKSITYAKLKMRWKNETPQIRRKRGWLVLLFILSSVLLPVLYGFIKHNILEGKSFFGN